MVLLVHCELASGEGGMKGDNTEFQSGWGCLGATDSDGVGWWIRSSGLWRFGGRGVVAGVG